MEALAPLPDHCARAAPPGVTAARRSGYRAWRWATDERRDRRKRVGIEAGPGSAGTTRSYSAFLKAATNSFRSIGLLLLMAPVRKSLAEGTCLPFQTSRNICFEDLKKQSASSSGFPARTSH